MKRLILLGLIFQGYLATAQNLVLNGDFETYSIMPCGAVINAGDFAIIYNNIWSSPTDGTPDIYSKLAPDTCSNHQPVTTFVSSFGSYIGTQAAQSGNTFVGIHTLIPGAHYREYVQGKLTAPVNIGDRLAVSMYVSAADGSQYATNNMGIDFSTSTTYKATTDALGTVPRINFTQVITDTAGWVLLTDTIVATAAWQYFVIGNFYDDAHTTAVQFNQGGDRGTAYYYIDNVSIMLAAANTAPPTARFTADAVVCAGTCVHFNNSSVNADTYVWSFPGSDILTSTGKTPTACYSNPGQYDVALIATGNNGSDTLLLKNYVTVNPLPVAGTITSSRDTICANSGITSQLTVTGYSGNIQWQSAVSGNSYVDISQANAGVYVTPHGLPQTTTYRVLVSNTCGTDTTNSITIYVVPSPVAAFTYVISGKQVTFNSSGSSSDVTIYDWDFNDGAASSEANPVHVYAKEDVYTVCLTVYNNSNCSYTFCQPVDLRSNNVPAVEGSVVVSPNPVVGSQLSVSMGTDINLAGVRVSVTDVLGRRLQNFIPAESKTLLDVGNLAAGTYIMSVQYTGGVIVRKFIKQ